MHCLSSRGSRRMTSRRCPRRKCGCWSRSKFSPEARTCSVVKCPWDLSHSSAVLVVVKFEPGVGPLSPAASVLCHSGPICQFYLNGSLLKCCQCAKNLQIRWRWSDEALCPSPSRPFVLGGIAPSIPLPISNPDQHLVELLGRGHICETKLSQTLPLGHTD